VVAVARKIPEDKGRAEKVLAALPSAKDLDARCSLLSVLGKIGDPAAMPVLREAIGDKEDKVKDAAVRALSDWPTAAPAADLLKVAQTSDNQVHRILALRGYVRLVGLESNRPAEETIKMYKEAMTLATNADEKRMVLSGVADAKSFDALQMAASCLDGSRGGSGKYCRGNNTKSSTGNQRTAAEGPGGHTQRFRPGAGAATA
jgi:hypothetical protein